MDRAAPEMELDVRVLRRLRRSPAGAPHPACKRWFESDREHLACMRTLQPAQAPSDRGGIPRPPSRGAPRNSGLRLLPRSHHVIEEAPDEQHRKQAENDRPD